MMGKVTKLVRRRDTGIEKTSGFCKLKHTLYSVCVCVFQPTKFQPEREVF